MNALTYAVRPRVVLKYIGQLGLMLALLTTAPLLVALLEGDWVPARRYLVVCALLLVAGAGLARMPAPQSVRQNEALSITALAFLLVPLFMAWPLMSDGISFADALFEAVSGATTTGLSALGGVEHRSATWLFGRAWMQWYGGLGVVVLSVALLMGHHVAVRRLAEPLGNSETFITAARTHARQVLAVYICLTVAGFAVVWPLAGDGFTALVHVLAAVSTGGFSSRDDSLAGMGPAAAAAIMLVAFLGAVSLPLYWRLAHSTLAAVPGRLLRDMELRALLLACLAVATVLGGLAWLQGMDDPWYHGVLMGFSAQTTTGFVTVPVAAMDPVSKLVMIVAMLVGGSVGSSAGGFKILRLLIILRLLQLTIRRAAMPPHAVVTPGLGGQPLADDDLLRAQQLVLLFIGVVVISWLPFLALGYDPLDALFEVASASGTVGLSAGITRPDLEPLLKAVLCFDMLAGRLEIVALLVVLYPRNWVGRREQTQ